MLIYMQVNREAFQGYICKENNFPNGNCKYKPKKLLFKLENSKMVWNGD